MKNFAYILMLALLSLPAGAQIPATSASPSPKATVSPQGQFDSKFNNLQAQMTFDQVKALLGPPDLRELKGSIETWIYNKGEGRRIVFENGKLIEFGRDQVSTQGATVAEGSVDIGGTCTKDRDCQSKNCHFHVCSGKNNCWVPENKVCATNDDCCSGFCDFGICHKRR